MGFADGLRSWFTWDGPNARASGQPISWDSFIAQSFGPGVGNQPSHATLLRESLSVADFCTRKIADSMSNLKPLVKRSTRDGTNTLVDEILDMHPLAELLARPHPQIPMPEILRLQAQWIVTTGEAYLYKVGNGFGLPVRLDPTPPSQITPLIEEGLTTGYLITDGNGAQQILDADLFIRAFFPDPENPWGSEGYLGPMGVVHDAHSFTNQHLRAHYEKDATPKTVLEATENAIDFTSDERDRFDEQWNQYYTTRTGTRVGRPAILPTGYKLVEMGLQTGADITPLLEHWRDDLLMNYGVPRSVLGQVTSGDRSSAETTEWIYEKHTLQPVANLWAQSATLQLAVDYEGDVFIEFDEFITEDKAHRLSQEQSDLDRKVRSINQVREDRGLDPVPWGEDPVEAAPEPVDEQEEEEEDEDLEQAERAAHIAVRKEFRERKRQARRSERLAAGS